MIYKIPLFKIVIIFGLYLIFSNYLFTQQPNDCINSIVVCGSSTFSLDVDGIGVQEVTNQNSCSSGENNSIWLEVNIDTAGTLAFTLTPDSNAISEDYDFFVFGPVTSCNNLGQAIRCSTTNPAAANQGNNLTGMNSTETETSEGPGPNGNSFVSQIDTLGGEKYFLVIDRPIGNSPFSIEWTGTAIFPENPINPVSPQLLNQATCDNLAPFDDGITEFNLSSTTADIINMQPNIDVNYFVTESDANINNNTLGDIFNSNSTNQTIYVRIEDTNSGCFIINTLELEVTSSPVFNEPSIFEVCDDTSDGDNTNGETVFDFSIKTDEITNGITNNYTISYHLNANDAVNNNAQLSQNYTNTTLTPVDIFVRIEDLDSGCIGFTDFQIIVNEIPEANNASLFQCDNFGNSDGISIFNLNEFYDEVTGNTPDRNLSFYRTLSDAETNTNAIEPIGYQNTLPTETLIVKVVNSMTQCENFAEITLNVSFTTANNAQLQVCDTDGIEDGFTNFDLSMANADVLNGLPPDLTLAYYETLDNALLEINPLDNNFTNTIAFNQTIYVRVENNNNCFGINEVDLEVFGLPNVETEFETIYCQNTFPETIVLTGGVIDDIPNNYYYNWSTGETTIDIEINEPGTYTVEVSNVSGCSKTRTITVIASDIATFENIEITDASSNNTVTVLVSGDGDYEFALDNSNGPYQNSNIFENVSPGIYTVYVRDKNECGISEELISVVGFPKFFTPNGDSQNDFWQVKGISSQFQPDTVIYIYNRHGKLLSEINPLGSGWDGNYNGNPMPTNDYWFSIKLQDGREFSSHFTLKR